MISKITNLNNFFDYKSITFKVILIVFLIVLVSLFILGYIINNSVSSEIFTITKQRNLEVVGILKKRVNTFLTQSATKKINKITKSYGLSSNNQPSLVAQISFRRY